MAINKGQGVDLIESYGTAEKFVLKNKNILTGVAVGVAIVGLLLVYYFKIHLPEIEEQAQQDIFQAERYFANDSMSLALNGDGNNPGFLEVIQDYKGSKTANLSRYYAGMAYLRLNDYQGAIEHLKKFKSDDTFVSTLAFAALGDAYMELGDVNKATKYFEKAANNEQNELITPIYLMKAGMAHEIAGKASKAKSFYERIKTDYPNSEEGKEIDKYIARAGAKI